MEKLPGPSGQKNSVFSRKIAVTIYCLPTKNTKDAKGTKRSEPFGPGTTLRVTCSGQVFTTPGLVFCKWGNLGPGGQPLGWLGASAALFWLFH